MTNCENSNLQQPDKHLGGVTYGGYSESIVVDEAFVLRVSDKLNLAATGPLLCAGITTYPRCATGTCAKARRSVSWGLAGSGTWA